MIADSQAAAVRLARRCFVVAVFLQPLPLAAAEPGPDVVTIDDLVSRERICRIAVSPDGRHVAYVSARGQPREDRYLLALHLRSITRPVTGTALFEVSLPRARVFAEPEEFVRSSAQVAWSPDGGTLVYTKPTADGMQLWSHARAGAVQRLVLDTHKLIDLGPQAPDGRLALRVVDEVPDAPMARTGPPNLALLVRDGFRFRSALDNPQTKPKLLVRPGTWDWAKRELVFKRDEQKTVLASGEAEWTAGGPAVSSMRSSASERTYRRTPLTSRSGRYVAAIEESRQGLNELSHASTTAQVIIAEAATPETIKLAAGRGKDRTLKNLLGWSSDDRWLYYVDVDARETTVNAVSMPDGALRLILRTSAELDPRPIFREAPLNLDAGARVAVLARNTNVMPDELVAVDLETGKLSVLTEPNAHFAKKRLPAVRFYDVENVPGGGRQYGRLFLPIDHREGQRHPVVFTHYISRPGFYASVGDELPILPLTAHGVAVFSLHSRESNFVSSQGDFAFEISRVKRPVVAMEGLIRKLSEEGLVDPDRVGLHGLSYGAEIAMYGLWTSRAFRAVSVASGSWEPTRYFYAGMGYAKSLRERGFTDPDTDSEGKWKQLSAALNARPTQPPLLVQGSDEEMSGTAASWFRLRSAGAPVEWHIYPDEGHVKWGAANRFWVYQRNLDWFRFWLKGEEDPDPAKAEQYARWREMRAKSEAARQAGATGKP